MSGPSPLARLWLALSLVAVIVAGAFVVTADNPVTRADLSIVKALAADRSSATSHVARFVTDFGSLPILALVTLAAGLGLWAAGRAVSEAALPALSLAAAAILDPLAKLAVGRPRPPVELQQVLETSTGYPSGHSAQSAAVFLMLAFVVARSSAHPGRWLAAGLLCTGLVGVSRVVLGVHSPTDVLGGWCLGAACALAISALDARTRR